MEILVKRKGLDTEESDWVTADSLVEDVPVLLQDFIADFKVNRPPKKAMPNFLSINSCMNNT